MACCSAFWATPRRVTPITACSLGPTASDWPNGTNRPRSACCATAGGPRRRFSGLSTLNSLPRLRGRCPRNRGRRGKATEKVRHAPPPRPRSPPPPPHPGGGGGAEGGGGRKQPHNKKKNKPSRGGGAPP